MEGAENGTHALLFMDASHFVLGCDYLGSIYCRVRRFVKSFSGRMRYNVLGAIDFVTKEVVTVTNDVYITATEVCEMLRKISAKYAGKSVHLVLDNARYQKCRVIPPYSPNLNLIERLWKFVKGELRSKYYDDFSTFQKKIDSIIASAAKDNLPKIKKLIGAKVQLFDGMKSITDNTLEYLPKGQKQAA